MKINNDSLSLHVEILKEKVIKGETLKINWRIEQINKINNLLVNHQLEIIEALYLDLGKSKIEALSEILLIKEEIALFKKKLRSWMSPKIMKTPFYLFPSNARVTFEPLGCILILGPYNYPLLYNLKPLVNIFAAGNTAIIKPSEKCQNTSKLLKKLISKYFSDDTLIVIEGNYKVSEKLASLDFDHIFFTGSTKTGKIIMQSAAKNLTPVTLELSGTNPVLILENADLRIAAKRIIWGKFFNSGQSCMAPNHIFVDKKVENKFIKELKKSINDFYGEDPINSENLSKLEEKQFSRTLEILKKSKEKGKVIYGGDFNKKTSKICPTILKINSEKDSLIKNELFSSMLPVMPVKNHQVALKIIQKNSKPLAIYIFGGNKKIHQNISNLSSSGTICINDVMLPVLIPNLPFGGVGESGIGKFHGEEGFKNFSNLKTITQKDNFLDITLRYPPYESILKFIKILFKI